MFRLKLSVLLKEAGAVFAMQTAAKQRWATWKAETLSTSEISVNSGWIDR